MAPSAVILLSVLQCYKSLMKLKQQHALNCCDNSCSQDSKFSTKRKVVNTGHEARLSCWLARMTCCKRSPSDSFNTLSDINRAAKERQKRRILTTWLEGLPAARSSLAAVAVALSSQLPKNGVKNFASRAAIGGPAAKLRRSPHGRNGCRAHMLSLLMRLTRLSAADP